MIKNYPGVHCQYFVHIQKTLSNYLVQQQAEITSKCLQNPNFWHLSSLQGSNQID